MRIGVFSDLDNPTQPLEWKEIHPRPSGLGLKLQSLGVRTANDFDATFEAALRERAQALINVAGSPRQCEYKPNRWNLRLNTRCPRYIL